MPWEIFTSFLPAVRLQTLKRMLEKIREMHLDRQMSLQSEEISRRLNPILRGWIQYYGKLYPVELRAKLFSYLYLELSPWLRKKQQRLRRYYRRSRGFLARIAQQRPSLCVHWRGVGVTAGCQEPDDARASRPDLWEPRGYVASGYPALRGLT